MPNPAQGKALEPMWGRRVIERSAWDSLERCRRTLKLDRVPLPIPIEDWLERVFDIRFGFADLSHLGKDVLGAVFTEEREILIDEKLLENEGRLRFTCAHELGHLILHQRVRKEFHELRLFSVFFSPDRYEREADRFAAALLMPVPLLERELVAIADRHGLKRGETVIQLMDSTLESEWLWRRIVLPDITRRFGVSLAAALYRFSDIQLKGVEGQPVLPREFINALQQRSANPDLDAVEIRDGRTVNRNLFDDGDATAER